MFIEKPSLEEEQKAGLNQIADKSLAQEAAFAEKPLRDIAREEGLNVTRKEKQILDSVAARKTDKLAARVNHDNKIAAELRADDLARAGERRQMPGVRNRFKKTETEISEEEWQALLEFTKDTDIYEIIKALHASKNQPLLIKDYPVVGRSPNLKLSFLNLIFVKSNLLYRLRPLEYSGKYQGAKTFKLFVVRQE